MMAILAGLGVLNSVLMVTRERVHDLGVFKAVGMTPRQTVTMVACWVVVPAIAAAVIGLPAGMVLHGTVMQALARDISQGLPGTSELPGVFVDVYAAGELPCWPWPAWPSPRSGRSCWHLGSRHQDHDGTAHRVAP